MPNRRQLAAQRVDASLPRAQALRERLGGDALVLTRPGSVNWLGGGISDPIDVTASSDPVWVVLTSERRVLISTTIEVPRLVRDFDVEALGFETLGVAWYRAGAMAEAVRDVLGPGARVLADVPELGQDVSEHIVLTRMALSEVERDELRRLGRDTSDALEQALASWEPGLSRDLDLAGEIAGALASHGAVPVCLIVGGDERLRQLRHPLSVGDVLNEAVMAVVVARRGGLHVAATRLAVTRASDPIVALTQRLASVDEAVRAASRPGRTWGQAVEALAEAYRAIGHEGAWSEHYQGGPIAFEQREFELAPGQHESSFWAKPCEEGCAEAWNPSLTGGAKIEETYLIGEFGLEPVTRVENEYERVKVVG